MQEEIESTSNIEDETDNSSKENLNNNSVKTEDQDQEQKQEQQQECRFKEGQKITLVKVRFPGNAKSFPFLTGKKNFSYGQKVVAMSDRGMDVGYINSFSYETTFSSSMLPLYSISKSATEEDLKKQKENIEKEKNAERICLRLIEKYDLNMNLTHVEFTQFGKKAVFYFTAPERVDFRELVKGLVSELKMRIELRQISVRDRTAALGAIGACGRQNCCSSFLKQCGNVNIKMAKNQNITLIPRKLNGVCGQIKCCIKYDDDIYSQKRQILPKEGSFIQTLNGDRGKVLKIHLLIEQFIMLTDSGKKRRYVAKQFQTNRELPPDWKFPTKFDHIVNETKELIEIKVPEIKRNNSVNKDSDMDSSKTSNPQKLQKSDNKKNFRNRRPRNNQKPKSENR